MPGDQIRGSDSKNPKPPGCERVEENDFKKLKCALCSFNCYDPASFGEVYRCEDLVCHQFCVLLSSSLVQNGEDEEGIYGFLPKDIKKEMRRGSRLRCNYCKQKGATIGCTVKTCPKTFHLPCGLKHGSMHQFFNQFLSFCSAHRPSQKVDPKVLKKARAEEDALICPICYEPVSNKVSTNTLWAPCCKKRWFHRHCVQRQALAQGYFFKCPMCNNNDKFNLEMRDFGIFIPEMDAAWEREPDAFHDLLETYNNCDAPKCKCPDGRSYSQNTGSWRVLRCNTCGSQGTHVLCASFKVNAPNRSWRCPSCAEVYLRACRELVTRSDRGGSSNRLEPSLVLENITITAISSSTRRPADVDKDSPLQKRSRVCPQLTACDTDSGSVSISDSNHEPISSINENIPGPSTQDASDDEIIVVDDSDDDVEVVEEMSSKKEPPVTSLKSPISNSGEKELFTLDGKAIKVHPVAAGDTVPKEVGSLGSVSLSHSSNHVQNQSRFDNSTATSISRLSELSCEPNHRNRAESCENEIGEVPIFSGKELTITNVRHSNELFSPHKEENRIKQVNQSPSRNRTTQRIYYLPVKIEGQEYIQPCIAMPKQHHPGHQATIPPQEPQHISRRDHSAVDIVTLE